MINAHDLYFQIFWASKAIPLRRVLVDEMHGGEFASPNPGLVYHFYNRVGTKVGRVEGNVSPIGDTFYLFRIDVEPEMRRKCYGFSILWNLIRRFGPVTPIHEIYSEFWARMHSLTCSKFPLRPEIRSGELDIEKKKWAHLSPIIAAHEKLVLAISLEAFMGRVDPALSEETLRAREELEHVCRSMNFPLPQSRIKPLLPMASN